MVRKESAWQIKIIRLIAEGIVKYPRHYVPHVQHRTFTVSTLKGRHKVLSDYLDFTVNNYPLDWLLFFSGVQRNESKGWKLKVYNSKELRERIKEIITKTCDLEGINEWSKGLNENIKGLGKDLRVKKFINIPQLSLLSKKSNRRNKYDLWYHLHVIEYKNIYTHKGRADSKVIEVDLAKMWYLSFKSHI